MSDPLGWIISMAFVVGVVSFVLWSSSTDLAHPEDFVKATAICELNEGWLTIEMNSPSSRTVLCRNGGVFKYERESK